MRLTPPTKQVFYVSIVFVAIGAVMYFVPAFSGAAFWIALIGYILLVFGVTKTGF